MHHYYMHTEATSVATPETPVPRNTPFSRLGLTTHAVSFITECRATEHWQDMHADTTTIPMEQQRYRTAPYTYAAIPSQSHFLPWKRSSFRVATV
jgi:hypothetical protein